jgi:uncharacterized protein
MRRRRHRLTEHEHHAHDHEHHISYDDAVRQFRAEKDEFFRTAEGSPIPAGERSTFAGLPYFEVDPALVVDRLALEPYTGTEPTRFQIPTSDGKLRPAERAGVFGFEVRGTRGRLTAYRMADGESESLFVPFLDATSGTETYGAGRYLDLFPEDDGTWTLDFNLAYHPSCVYDARFSCPLTPPENRLPVPIEAGERLPIGKPAPS